MLDKLGPLWEWAVREQPDDWLWRQVSEMVFLVSDRPWRAPSRPLSLPEGQPAEIRALAVPDTNIVINYEHHHSTGVVNLLLVTAST